MVRTGFTLNLFCIGRDGLESGRTAVDGRGLSGISCFIGPIGSQDLDSASRAGQEFGWEKFCDVRWKRVRNLAANRVGWCCRRCGRGSLGSGLEGNAFPDVPRVKQFTLESKALTAFRGSPVRMRAGVALPESHGREPGRTYPVVYEVPGFGGNHFSAIGRQNQGLTKVAGLEVIWVVLDPDCPFGHHVFADSENNGPWGQALTRELMPALEKEFGGDPGRRVVTGHSSGGWSSLWLQVSYPEVFRGVWSTAPDPVDFRDFQRIDLYAAPGVSVFVDEVGTRRPIARRNDKPVLFYRDFSDMEVVMGRGGQLGSFEAVFGPKGISGQPRPLWDRASGRVDPSIMRSWERYDIRRLLERQWSEIGPKLAGKIQVHTGSADTFYLEGAAVLLKESLYRLKSDAVVEIHPGKDHGNVLTPELRTRMEKQMRAWLEAKAR